MKPGPTQLARIPKRPSSRATPRNSISIAAFGAAEQMSRDGTFSTAAVITATSAPPPALRCGKVAHTRLNAPLTSASKTDFHSAGVMLLMNFSCRCGPAAYTTDTHRPSFLAAAFTKAFFLPDSLWTTDNRNSLVQGKRDS